jgi:antitoxin component YwqK of YwqJK toxin-antitoxin module
MGNFKLILILLLICSTSFGQNDTLNQYDAEGKKTGYWIITGKIRPSMGYCDTCKISEGQFVANRKVDKQLTYFKNGKIKLIANYKRGRPVGAYIKYWENGVKREEGSFAKGKQQEVLKKYSQNGGLLLYKFFNEDGREEGWTSYYYENCDTNERIDRKQFEYFKRNGVTQFKSYRYYYSGCIQEIRDYEDDGTPAGGHTYKNDCLLTDTLNIGTEGDVDKEEPCGKKDDIEPPGKIIDPIKFDPNGYNRLYNENDDLWMEGYFKKGKLFNGRLYHYDENGLFTKMEIWENGNYLKLGDIENLDPIKIPDYINRKYPPKRDDEINEDGEYRDGKLWNGKKYVYDEDGILLQIEIWKKGKFVENGVLDVGNDGYKDVPATFGPPYKDGYHMIYDENHEIWLEGEFKDFKFWRGKHYIYGDDGLLERIEVWVDGKYHSDAQL